MAIRNRKDRRAAYAKASSQRVISKNHPVNRIAKLVQKIKSRITTIEGTNDAKETETSSS